MTSVPPRSKINVLEVELELHGIFWFHTYAQPRDKYAHMSLPIIHNYPIMLSLLGRPVEHSYLSVSDLILKTFDSSKVWSEHGFYVYPAVGTRVLTRSITFSLGDTEHMTFKTKIRAPVPDLTVNQVYLPGSVFKTYVLLNNDVPFELPEFIRLGAKRYGIFKVNVVKAMKGEVRGYASSLNVTHPYNADDCPSSSYYGILRHYAGNIALTGVPFKVVKAGSVVLASPSFLTG